jgi:hypothetical protein
VAGAFLSLAHQQLLAIETNAISGMPFKPSDPTEAFRHYLADSTTRYYLADQGRDWLYDPIPRVYGLGIEDVVPPVYLGRSPVEKNALPLAIWRLVSQTGWARVDDARSRSMATERITNTDVRRLTLAIEPLPSATPLAALCARLDAGRPCGVGQLGTILAYACGRTGNGYADHSRMEMRDRHQQLIKLDWYLTAETFARERADQQAAAKWASACSRLDGRLWKTPELLGELTQVIAATAQDVTRSGDTGPGRAARYDPRALINQLALHQRGSDETEIEPASYHEAEALAAPAPAPVPA